MHVHENGRRAGEHTFGTVSLAGHRFDMNILRTMP